jgi:succinyl-CoA synthetase alpha subunit
MGHAGAWAAPGEGSALTKWKALESAGVTMVDHPAKFGGVMKGMLSSSGRDVPGIVRNHMHSAFVKYGQLTRQYR